VTDETTPGTDSGVLDSPPGPPGGPDASGASNRQAETTGKAVSRRDSVLRRVIEWVVVLAIAALVALGLRTFVVQTFFVPSGSMLPTLQIGDRILVDRLPWVTDDLHRGDIVVFRRVPADTDASKPADLVKRVVGLPGETISSKVDVVYINGRPLSEPWLPNFNDQPAAYLCGQSAFDITTQKIPAGHYFMMGDCRGNSLDSRSWGTVPQSYIVGKVFLVIWRHGHPWFHWF
jgi:signal peptidase I